LYKKVSVLGLLLVLAGCSHAGAGVKDNGNSGTALATTTRPGPDNSDISTGVDANGVKTETRVFRTNPHVSKVVVTTRNGVSTTHVYSRSGEEKELNSSDSRNALEETGDAIAKSAGFVADKTAAGVEKGVEVGKTAAEKTADTAKKVGDKTAEGAKTVGEKTATGAKKAGKAIKKAITP
jgi:hypothetical protein